MAGSASQVLPESQSAGGAPKLSHADVQAFERGGGEIDKFWARLGGRPDLNDKTVLDVGSGWGRLCVEIARAGARKVVGLDLKPELVAFSSAIVKQRYPELGDRVVFEARDLSDYDDAARFDCIVSKDSFEHILDLTGTLEAMRRRLRLGGRVYAGFGPLYTSPYGDHDRRETAFRSLGPLGTLIARTPWLHLAIEREVMRRHARSGKVVVSMRDLGLNGLSYSDYLRILRDSGMFIVDLRVNQNEGLASRALSTLARVPALKDYCIHNVYCVLEKR